MHSYAFLRDYVSTSQAPRDSVDEMFAGDDIAVVLHLTSPISVGWTRVDEPTDGHETRVWPRFVIAQGLGFVGRFRSR